MQYTVTLNFKGCVGYILVSLFFKSKRDTCEAKENAFLLYFKF